MCKLLCGGLQLSSSPFTISLGLSSKRFTAAAIMKEFSDRYALLEAFGFSNFRSRTSLSNRCILPWVWCSQVQRASRFLPSERTTWATYRGLSAVTASAIEATPAANKRMKGTNLSDKVPS